MTAVAAPAPQAPPVPDDFPVRWDGQDHRLTWEFDQTNFPHQVAPLEAELVSGAVARGLSHAARVYELPLRGFKSRAVNGYVYNAAIPLVAEPAELEELSSRSAVRLMRANASLGERWDDHFLPELRSLIAASEAIDVETATVGELLAHLRESRARLDRMWEIHFEAMLPASVAVSEFEEMCQGLFPDDDRLAAPRMLQGIDDKTAEIERELFRLSRRALDSPTVARVLEEEDAADVPARLAESDAGQAFLAVLRAHLDDYGHRGATWGLSSPSFIEDPTPVIEDLKDHVTQPDSAHPSRELARQAGEREATVAAVRERLADYPAAVVAEFEAMLAAARVALRLTADQRFCDLHGVDSVRQVVMALGRRLAGSRLLDAPEDVLMFEMDELALAGCRYPCADLRPVAAARRARLARFADVTPPPALGTLPAGSPPAHPTMRAQKRFAGIAPAPVPVPAR